MWILGFERNNLGLGMSSENLQCSESTGFRVSGFGFWVTVFRVVSLGREAGLVAFD